MQVDMLWLTMHVALVVLIAVDCSQPSLQPGVTTGSCTTALSGCSAFGDAAASCMQTVDTSKYGIVSGVATRICTNGTLSPLIVARQSQRAIAR